MKFSQIQEEKLQALTPEKKYEFVCSGIKDDGKSADVAILLGCWPTVAKERALACAELYRQGRVKYIVPSGGVKWDVDGEMISEADYMSDILMQNGVPQSAIIPDNEARTTKENMICSTLALNRRRMIHTVDSVIIVTSVNHMKRSLALAKGLLPRKFEFSAYPAYHSVPTEEWLKSEKNIQSLSNAIALMKELVNDRIIEDFDVDESIFD